MKLNHLSKIGRQEIVDLGHHTMRLHSQPEAPVPGTLPGLVGLMCSGMRLKCKMASCFAFFFEGHFSEEKGCFFILKEQKEREKLEVKQDLGRGRRLRTHSSHLMMILN